MIRIGPGGVEGMGYEKGIPEIALLGLNALEIEFTHSIHLSNERAREVGGIARRHGIALSIHAPYFINLASTEKSTIDASLKRILDSLERGHHMGATHVVYHSGYFQKQDPAAVTDRIMRHTALLMDRKKENGWKTAIAPELTGKPSQFGSLPELLDLRRETGCDITIDFAHQKAREQGDIAYADILDQLKGLKHVHSHFSGIAWGPKGEKNHLPTTREDILPLAQEITKRRVDITLISESPQPFEDAVLTRTIIEELEHGVRKGRDV